MKSNAAYKIGVPALVALLVTFIGSTEILLVPYETAAIARQDAWMAPIIVLPATVYIIYITCRLANFFPDKGFIEYLPLITGKYPGKLIGLGYFLYFVYFASTVIRQALAFLYGTGIFRVTPLLAIGLLLMVATTYAVASGIEVISRTIWCLWIVTAVFFALAAVMALPIVELSALFPIGEAGLKTILKSSILPHAFSGEIFLLVILFPFIRSQRDAIAGGLIATVILSVFVSLTIILCIAIMGAETTSRTYFSVFSLVNYLETTGAKIVLATIWILVFWGKIAIAQFVVTSSLSQLCGFKNDRFLILPAAMMLLIFSQVFYPNNTDLFSSISMSFPGLVLFFNYIMPSVLLLITLLRFKPGKFSTNIGGASKSQEAP